MKTLKIIFLMVAAILVVPCAKVQVASDHMDYIKKERFTNMKYSFFYFLSSL